MTKDWIGNKKSIFATLGASNHSTSEREANDYYATEPTTIDKLLGAIELPTNIWECACGEGHLSERLKQFGHHVVSSDIVNRGYGEVVDFLKTDSAPTDCKCILTNPPYKYALEFVLHALDILPQCGLCVMFLKTTFLEGQKRYNELFKFYPPLLVLQFSKRVLCAKNGEFEKFIANGGSAASYAWFVWQKGFKGAPTIRWL